MFTSTYDFEENEDYEPLTKRYYSEVISIDSLENESEIIKSLKLLGMTCTKDVKES